MNRKTIVFITFLISLSGCQIDKRVYRNGYSMISGRDTEHQAEKPNINREDICFDSPFDETTKIEDISSINRINTSDSIKKCSESQNDGIIYCCNNPLTVSTEIKTSDCNKPICHNRKSIPASHADDPPKTHWAGIVSFALALASVFAVFLNGFIILFIYFAAIPTLILGIIGLNKTRKNPDKFKNRIFAIIGIAIPALLVLLSIVFLVLLANSLGE